MTSLDEIRDSLEGVVPGIASTCSAEGVPNVCYISQVEYTDPEHVALSFQFFNKTRQNVLANPQAVVAVVDPESAAVHRLHLHYLRTETAGAVFERMRAKLASIANATGMTEVFKLRGADIYRVERIEQMPGRVLQKAWRPSRLAAVRNVSDALACARDLGQLIDSLLEGLANHFGIEHAMVLAIDRAGGRFYALASRGYGDSGVGAEIPLGAGAVGVAAAARVPIRLAHAAADYAYVRAVRENAAKDPLWASRLELGIPFPGLPAPHSQLAVPIEADDEVLGVLYVESAEQRRFSYEDEDALVTLARQLGLSMRSYDEDAEAATPSARASSVAAARPLTVKYFPENGSIFCDEEYLIRGVAGAILWKILSHYQDQGRSEFSNRELRLDRSLGLPEIGDNLEARLLLLERRLREKNTGLGIRRTERGRFSLNVERSLTLVSQA
ncbi:MAG TPA: GAF domain-containing protein [Polyangiaceae bacterium]